MLPRANTKKTALTDGFFVLLVAGTRFELRFYKNSLALALIGFADRHTSVWLSLVVN